MKHLKVKCLSVDVNEESQIETAQLSILEGNEGKEPSVIGWTEIDENEFGKFEVGNEYDLDLEDAKWAEIEAAAKVDGTSEETELKIEETVDSEDIVDTEAKQEVQE